MCFFKAFIKELIEEGSTVDIATNISESDVPACYREWGCKVYSISCTRSPFDKGNFRAIKEIRRIATEGKYELIHCHTPIAAMCTRLACRKLRKNGLKVIYTAHGFHFCKGAPLKNWLLYYPVEWLCAHWTDVLITINEEDYTRAQKHIHAKRVEYVPGVGIDLQKFAPNRLSQEEKDCLRESIGVGKEDKLLLSVGELNANKNHSVVIRALAKLQNPSLHYAIAGVGELHDDLLNLAAELGVADRVHLLGYRNDVADLYQAANICVFPSIREGLGLAAIEGMASGLPLVCADNRGTRDYAINGENAMVCRYNAIDEFAQAVETIVSDENMSENMGKLNFKKSRKYDVNNVITYMKKIYGETECQNRT